MKTKIAMIALMGLSFAVTAQNDYLTGQTKLVNPTGRTLLLERNDNDSWLTFHKSGSAWFSMGIDQSNSNNFSLNYGGTLTSSQFVMTREGKIGIGTAVPQAIFNIVHSGTIGGTNLANSSLLIGSSVKGIGIDENEIVVKGQSFYTGTSSENTHMIFRAGGIKDRMIVRGDSGNIGIGTNSPSQKLDVNGHVKFDALGSNNTNLQIGHGVNDRIIADNTPNRYYGGGMFFRITPDPSLNIPHNYIDVMMLTDEGNVGIGISDTKGFKLGVNGKIAATEVKVATYANWPDYVFEKEYKLPTLQEVENHIKTKGHLANIPSAKEVAKNGILLGEMNKNLLQKIEELTLYTIQQEKEIEKLKEKNKEIKSLSDRLAKLEKLLENKN